MKRVVIFTPRLPTPQVKRFQHPLHGLDVHLKLSGCYRKENNSFFFLGINESSGPLPRYCHIRILVGSDFQAFVLDFNSYYKNIYLKNIQFSVM